MSGAEQVTKILSATLTDDTIEAIKAKSNIGNQIKVTCCSVYNHLCFVVLKAERVSNDSLNRGYVFPDEDDNLTAYTGGITQLSVPVGLLQNVCKYNHAIINLQNILKILKHIIASEYCIHAQ